ncbi:MAG TPA: MFS transporter [Candidatus Acidoferrales bacterium]|nr:MFS transporter [Candidatus Acidoferrales bacterium]
MKRHWRLQLVFTLLLPAAVWADVGHEHGIKPSASLWVWAIALAFLALAVSFLIKRAGPRTLSPERLKAYSRNARLLLLRAPFSGLSVSLIRLLFNLYLLAAGFDTLFVAKFVAVNWTFHGLSVIPSGILSDLFGRRRVFLTAYTGNLLATAAVIFVTEPGWLLVLAALVGLCEGAHAIVGPPFMTEQSRPDERVDLFSLNGGIQVAAASCGNLAAGILPFLFAALLGLEAESAWARRAALLCAIPIMALSMIPIYLIEEEWKPIDIRRWVRNLESYDRIGMLAITDGLVAFGMGFSAPFFNVFFEQNLRASTDQIGLIFALGSVTTAVVMLYVPMLVERWGRVRTVTIIKLLGVPSLILLGMSQSVLWAGALYILTILFIGGPFPNRGISDPVYSLFAMEIVKERERGTTNGIMHAASEFPMGVGAAIAGEFMAVGDWRTPYVLGAAIFALGFILYYVYFARIDVRESALQPMIAG